MQLHTKLKRVEAMFSPRQYAVVSGAVGIGLTNPPVPSHVPIGDLIPQIKATEWMHKTGFSTFSDSKHLSRLKERLGLFTCKRGRIVYYYIPQLEQLGVNFDNYPRECSDPDVPIAHLRTAKEVAYLHRCSEPHIRNNSDTKIGNVKGAYRTVTSTWDGLTRSLWVVDPVTMEAVTW